MATKPKPDEPHINPKMLAIAAKLDAERARYKNIITTVEDSMARDDITDPVLDGITALEEKLAKMAATNLEELKLKARCICYDGIYYDPGLRQASPCH